MINNNEIDMTLAIQLQAQFEEELRVQRIKEEEKKKSLDIKAHKWNAKWKELPEPEQEKLSVSLIDHTWELLDPSPNIYDLFLTFNHQFFWGRLLGVEVKWSPRMTLCAGVCSYEGRGGLCSVRLSTPLLKLRPRKDLVETLLHEMIHAYLFVTHNNTDHDGHGPQFHSHMYRINKLAGTKISVYHSFHDEVNVYRQHVWQCNGPCRSRPPYYGLLKRSMNRAPSSRDPWWDKHVQYCGGTYTKIKEPDGYGLKKNKRKMGDKSVKDIRSYFTDEGLKKSKSVKDKNTPNSLITIEKENSRKELDSKINSAGNHNKSQNSSNIQRFDGKLSANSSSKNPKSSPNGFRTTKETNMNGFKTKKGKSLATNAIGTSFGSKTVVVKKKTSVIESDKSNEVMASSFDSFTGIGHVLGNGSSQRGISRLLDKFDKKNGREKIHMGGPSSSKVSQSNSSSDLSEEKTICPLCQGNISTDAFEEHIAVCLGDDLDIDFETIPSGDNENLYSQGMSLGNNNQSKNLSATGNKNDSIDNSFNRELNKSVIIIDDDEKTIFESNDPIVSVNDAIENLYPCPVCNENFSEGEINNHTNSHFT